MTVHKHIFFLIIGCIAFFYTSGITRNSSAFIENKGQIVNQNNEPNNEVLYLYCGKGYKVQLRKNGYSYEVLSYDNLPEIHAKKNSLQNSIDLNKTLIRTSRVDIDFHKMNADPEIFPENENSDYLNYFTNGNQISYVKSFNKVTYKNIFPHTDIEFVITDNAESPFKYNIILHPGADINNIQFLCKGAGNIIMSNEELIFTTALGNISEKIPFSYYTDKPQENTSVHFSVKNSIISFYAKHNNNKTLVIDPSTNRIWGTYFGDVSLEYCTSAGNDTLNNIYMAGYTLSSSNVATSGTYQSVLNGSFDAYLVKFNAAGVRQWGTYFGGSSVEAAYAIFVQKNGIVYISGDTFSTSNVASLGAHQTTYGGGIDDAILVKFDASGILQWSTYYGGTLHDIAEGVVVDNNGDVIMTGHSESANTLNVIATPGAYSTVYSLNYDVFIAKFNSNGVRQWGTYYGDTGTDEGWAITCDAANNIYVTGITVSLFGISTPGAHQIISGGNQDAFVAKFSPSGTNLIWGTYYGGGGDDQGTAIDIDNTGRIYIGGNTTSTNNIASVGANQISIASADDGMLAGFSSAGTRLWGTYFGGNDVDYIRDLTIDADMNLLFCGSTQSSLGISTTGAFQSNLSTINFYDAYFAKFSNTGKLKLATYYGGTDNDMAKGIAYDRNGKVYIAGETSSTGSISTTGSHMPTYGGSGDAFLAKFCVAPEPKITPSGTYSLCSGNGFTLAAQPGFSSYLWNTGYTSNPLSVSNATNTGTFYYTVNVTDGFGCDGTSDSVQVIVNLCTSVSESIGIDKTEIFPVPANDLLHIHFSTTDEDRVLNLYSANGSLISTHTTPSLSHSLNIAELASGLYFLTLQTGKTFGYLKFIKE